MSIHLHQDRGAFGELSRPERRPSGSTVYEGRIARSGPMVYDGDVIENRDAEGLREIERTAAGRPVTLGHPAGLVRHGTTAQVIGAIESTRVEAGHVIAAIRDTLGAGVAGGWDSAASSATDTVVSVSRIRFLIFQSGSRMLQVVYCPQAWSSGEHAEPFARTLASNFRRPRLSVATFAFHFAFETASKWSSAMKPSSSFGLANPLWFLKGNCSTSRWAVRVPR